MDIVSVNFYSKPQSSVLFCPTKFWLSSGDQTTTIYLSTCSTTSDASCSSFFVRSYKVGRLPCITWNIVKQWRDGRSLGNDIRLMVYKNTYVFVKVKVHSHLCSWTNKPQIVVYRNILKNHYKIVESRLTRFPVCSVGYILIHISGGWDLHQQNVWLWNVGQKCECWFWISTTSPSENCIN
jgi:hypothetical protein